jgi:ABC-type amino acid transport substrate-binding protein
MSRLLTWCCRLALAAAGLCLAAAGQAGEVLARVQSGKEVKVCVWPAYQGISWREPRSGELQGLDIELARALGEDLQLQVVFVDTQLPNLAQDLNSGRCDVAMTGVAILPQRLQAMAFTAPYLHGDIYAITTRTNRVVRQWADIDQPGVQVGVLMGTFMEPVMQERLRHAQLVRLAPPQTRERELQAGRIDVFMTDYPYSQTLVRHSDWAVRLASPQPFYPLPYGYACQLGDAQWLQVLNDFVTRIRKDGRLAQAAQRHGLQDMLRP